jgi:hypothetical protein
VGGTGTSTEDRQATLQLLGCVSTLPTVTALYTQRYTPQEQWRGDTSMSDAEFVYKLGRNNYNLDSERLARKYQGDDL